MQENISYSHSLGKSPRCSAEERGSNSVNNLGRRPSCGHRGYLSILLFSTHICTLHSFDRRCWLTLTMFLRGRSFRTTSLLFSWGSSVLESCNDLLKSMTRLVLRLELDFETFWLHFKGSVHCTSLPHVKSAELVSRSHNMYMGLQAVFGACPSGWGEMWSRRRMVPRNSAPREKDHLKGWAERQVWESEVYRTDLARERWVWDTGWVCQGQGELGAWAHRADEVCVCSYRSCLCASHWSHSVCYT